MRWMLLVFTNFSIYDDPIFWAGRPKKLFILLNPFGGRKSASKIFIDEVKPLLEDANVEFMLQGITWNYIHLIK